MRLYESLVTAEPATEPATAADVRANSRITDTSEDTLIERYITVARRQCEQIAKRSFITQTRTVTLDRWPVDDVILLPYGPLQSVSSIVYVDSNGDSHTFDAANYDIDTSRIPPRISLAHGAIWPTETLKPYGAITITYIAGYGDNADDVPAEYRQAVIMLAGHFFENREPFVVQQGVTVAPVPWSVQQLLMLNRGY